MALFALGHTIPKTYHFYSEDLFTMIEVTSQNFEDAVLRAQKPFVLNFWAPWCDCSRDLMPVLDRLLADTAAAPLQAGNVNADEQPELTDRFEITFLPTLCFFQNGILTDAAISPLSTEDLENWLFAHLSREA